MANESLQAAQKSCPPERQSCEKRVTDMAEEVVTAILAGVSLLTATVIGFSDENGTSASVIVIATVVAAAAFLGATYAAASLRQASGTEQRSSETLWPTVVWQTIFYHLGILGFLVAVGALGFQESEAVGLGTSVLAGAIALVIVKMALKSNDAAS